MSEAQEFKAAMEGLDRSEDRPWERDRSDSLSAPRRPRMSFSEVPEELLSLDLNDIALPPMNSKAEVKKSHHYSLRDLIRNTDALPPVNELRPKQKEGKIVIDPMRDRARYQPLAPGTPTRFQALLSLRDSAGTQGQLTADFFSRTGLEIPSELDPDIPSRRESNLSASDWDPDEELETKMNRLPPLPESISENDLTGAFAAKGLTPKAEAGAKDSWPSPRKKDMAPAGSPRSVPKSDNFSLGAATGQASSARAEDGDNKRESGIDLDLNVSLADKVVAVALCASLTAASLYLVVRLWRRS